MIFPIALKELYNNLVSARFVMGFILCLFLIPFTMIVNINDYKSRVRIYEVDRKNAEENLKTIVWSGLRPEIVRPPEYLKPKPPPEGAREGDAPKFPVWGHYFLK